MVSKKSYRISKNEDIESKKLIPMEMIFANQLLLGKSNGFKIFYYWADENDVSI